MLDIQAKKKKTYQFEIIYCKFPTFKPKTKKDSMSRLAPDNFNVIYWRVV